MKQILTFLFLFAASYTAAQNLNINLTSDEVRLIAKLVIGEAEGESFIGKKLVAETILNRLVAPNFPKSVQAIIEQPGQYDARWNASLWAREPQAEDLAAVQAAIDDPSLPIDVIFYVRMSTLPEGNSWRKRLESLGHYKTEGAHSFYYGFDTKSGITRHKKVTMPKGMVDIKMSRDNTIINKPLNICNQ